MKLFVIEDDGSETEIHGRVAELIEKCIESKLDKIKRDINIDEDTVYTVEEILELIPEDLMTDMDIM